MPPSIAPLKISILEKRALEYVIKTGSDVTRTRAKILLALAVGKSFAKINKEMGISGSVVNRWRNRWLASTQAPSNWDDAIAKVEEIVGVGMGRPKKIKSVEEISAIIELSECSKDQKPSKSKHQHNKQVAVAAAQSGLPELSPRTIGRLLEKNKHKEQ
ncbi:hypothetical protein DSM106972_091910 [Dulcicalothrix desertica PCC 7102]|uniref:Transposase n=1 Tax=Dulcicalothrix desertica PCC 7102 TaxID=232991 RepID=A0A3S1A723_9CYAN|nr:helix-turn-helix domain-containing protein [Dulcicalothrix desertica]RUS94940.1 hypothetical protein DSM106972_091910 [Dulcicalothrix desertica PCC 7102]TWH62827.1 Homeodomain-like domain-containing protein [Dulcicalothrix desertica PCC 7102]